MVASKKTMAEAEADLYLPDECWEHVLTFILNDEHHQRYFESLSLVSKQLLSMTNRFKFSLTICDPILPFLPRLFHRFLNLTTLDLTRFRSSDLDALHLDELLCQISNFPLPFKSLNLSNHTTIPINGLQTLAKKMKTCSLKSLICSNMRSLNHTDLLLIADCFPFLEELDLSLPQSPYGYSINYSNSWNNSLFNFGIQALSLALPNLRKINLSRNFEILDYSLFHLCKNCHLLEEIVMFNCNSLTIDGIASAIRERPTLKSFSITNTPFGTTKYMLQNSTRHILTSHFIDSLVSLKGLTCLDLSFSCISDQLLSSIANEALPLRKLVLQGCCNYTYAAIFYLLCKCQFLQHLDLQDASFLNDQCVSDLSLLVANLVSINVSGCHMLTDSAMAALVRNCPLLSEIRMEATSIGKRSFDFVNSHHQVKSLHLACNSWLKNDSINSFASIFPNLELLDLGSCYGISDQGIVEVLRRCLKIRHLTVKSNPRMQLLGMNFQVPKLEVLNMSKSRIDDKTLYVISKSCCGLLHLDLQHCVDVTEKGVRLVMENCTKLREINLGFCHKVAANVFAWMVISRPSLRKIIAPLHFRPTNSERKLLLQHGCLIGNGYVEM